MKPSQLFPPLALLVLIAACHAGDKHAVGQACGVGQPCRSFLTCVDGRCQPPPADSGHAPGAERDAGPDVADEVGAVSSSPDVAPEAGGEPVVWIADPAFDPARLWPQKALRYCWETGRSQDGVGSDTPASDHPAFEYASILTARTLAETWGRAADIRISDHGPCPPWDSALNVDKVTIYFAAGEPSAGLGYLAGAATRVHMDPASPTLRSDVVYAFGRALGLEVLANRQHTDLAPVLVVAARAAYGRKPAGTLVSDDNRCVQFGGSDPIPSPVRQPIYAVECKGGETQTWKWMPTLALAVSVRDVPICVAATNPLLSELVGGALESLYCTGEETQAFRFKSVQWRGPGNLCVGWDGEARAGAPLVLTTCSQGTRSKAWSVEPGVQIRHNTSGLCVLASLPQGPQGSPLRLGACNDPLARLAFAASGALFDSRLCAASPTLLPSPGQPLTWEPCLDMSGVPAAHQQFHVSGRITSRFNLCLSKARGGAGSTPVLLDPCDNGTVQDWDFYFQGPTVRM